MAGVMKKALSLSGTESEDNQPGEKAEEKLGRGARGKAKVSSKRELSVYSLIAQLFRVNRRGWRNKQKRPAEARNDETLFLKPILPCCPLATLLSV